MSVLDDVPITLTCAGEGGVINLLKIYIGICSACGQVTGMVPGGECGHCEAPEDQVTRDPTLTTEYLRDQLGLA